MPRSVLNARVFALPDREITGNGVIGEQDVIIAMIPNNLLNSEHMEHPVTQEVGNIKMLAMLVPTGDQLMTAIVPNTVRMEYGTTKESVTPVMKKQTLTYKAFRKTSAPAPACDIWTAICVKNVPKICPL